MKTATKVIMIILLIVGAFLTYLGVNIYIDAINQQDVIGTPFGMIFGLSIAIIGGGTLLFDLIVLIIYLLRQRGKVKA